MGWPRAPFASPGLCSPRRQRVQRGPRNSRTFSLYTNLTAMDAQPRPTEPSSAAKSTGVAASEQPTNLAASALSQMEGVSQDKGGAHQAGREILSQVPAPLAARRSPRVPAALRLAAAHAALSTPLPPAGRAHSEGAGAGGGPGCKGAADMRRSLGMAC